MRFAAYQTDIAQNLGAMIRLSACFSVPLDIIEPCGFPLSIRTLKRTAMDYADLADLSRHDSWQDFKTAWPARRRVLLTTKGATNLWQFAFQPGDTLILGRESAGVPEEVHNDCHAHVVVPIAAATRSLNVSQTAGIALAEGLRQLGRLT